MSMTALLRGTEAYLKTRTLDVRNLKMGIHPDGRPDPTAGLWYVSLFPVGKSPVPTRNAAAKKEETFSVGLTLTTRFVAPRTKQGQAITLEDVGITDMAERFEDYVHGNYALILAATGKLADPTNGAFCEPLLWQGTRYTLKDNSWVWSTIPTAAEIIYVAEMTFSGAKRIRNLLSA